VATEARDINRMKHPRKPFPPMANLRQRERQTFASLVKIFDFVRQLDTLIQK
jgi:hypothetical protein